MEILLFILAAIIGFIPSFMDIKDDNKDLNWWRRLNWAGRIYVILFIPFLGTGVWLTLVGNSHAELRERIADKNHKTDSLSIAILTQKVFSLSASDSAFKSALKNGGYTFDSVRGRIESNNIQKVESGGRAIQNNAPNQGIQNLGDGDIYVNAKKELTEKGKQLVISEINKYTKELNVDCCVISMHSKGNGDLVFHQILKIFDDSKIAVDITYSEFNGQPPPNGIMYSVKDGKLKILVGDY